MPVNRNALIRYETIDNCLRRRSRRWTLDDLIEACSDALYEYEGIDKRLGIQYNSIGGYIRRNYPEAIEKHNSLLENMGVRFAEGIARLQNSNATINAVMQELGYNEYFRQYIKTKYPELLNRETTRKKITGTKVAARKYAEAMEQMRTTTDTMKDICARLGVNIDSFRKYISKHAPELMRRSKK